MRIAISTLIGTLFVTGCIFPSFDNMQNGTKKDGDDESTPAATAGEETVKRTDLPTDPSPDASTASSSPDASSPAVVDGSADANAAAPPPGAGKVACGGETCTANSGSTYCCAAYVQANNFECRNTSELIPGACAGGDGHALFCDEKADCPSGQICCDQPDGIGTVAKCATSCNGGKILCKEDFDCPSGKTCSTTTVDNRISNRVCSP